MLLWKGSYLTEGEVMGDEQLLASRKCLLPAPSIAAPRRHAFSTSTFKSFVLTCICLYCGLIGVGASASGSGAGASSWLHPAAMIAAAAQIAAMRIFIWLSSSNFHGNRIWAGRRRAWR